MAISLSSIISGHSLKIAASRLIIILLSLVLILDVSITVNMLAVSPAKFKSSTINAVEGSDTEIHQGQQSGYVNCSTVQECGEVKNISYPFRIGSKSGCKVPNQYFNLSCESGKLYALTNWVWLSQDYVDYDDYFASDSLLEVKAITQHSLIVNNSYFVAAMIDNGNSKNRSCGKDSLSSNLLMSLILPPVGEGPFVVSKENKVASFGCSSTIVNTVGVFRHSDGQLRDFEGFDTGGCSIFDPESGGENNAHCLIQPCCVYSFPENSSVYGIRYLDMSVDKAPLLANSTFYNKSICPEMCSGNNATIFYDKQLDRFKLTWAIPLPTNYTPFSKFFANNRTSYWDLDLDDRVSLSPSDPLEIAIRKNLSNFACSHDNGTQIVLIPSVWGYRCSCKAGYEGDVYLEGSNCSDINECKDNLSNNCTSNSRCNNEEGSYTCKCKWIFHIGDGKTDGSGCYFPKVAIIIIIVIPTSVLFILLIPCVFLQWWKRKLREKNFVQNGGLQLQEYIQRSGRDATRVFTHDELSQATEKFSASMKIGVGGYGVVYKGILANGREVAIKMATKQSGLENEEFINEIAILSQINHRHIVKLLGCCLETTCPLLVYEYVSNGNLADNLEKKGDGVMPWDQRLKIAKQTSEALAYLHSIASPPILHRDVKSTNVLLDNSWDAKVADFGVSRLLPEGSEHVSTAIKGTLGYLDPEYFQTLQLTDKSDVYSFGVLLVELITTLKPVDTRNRSQAFSNLALLFIHHMKQGTIQELIDHRLLTLVDNEKNDIQSKVQSTILSVASLARRCISLVGTDRPSMSVVANELHNIYQSLVFIDVHDESTIPLLDCHDASDGGAVIVENSQYCIQSDISQSMSISSSMVNMPTIPR